MFAISTLPNGQTSFRAIDSEADLQPGETLASEPPPPTLDQVKASLCLDVDGAADIAYVDIGGPSPGRLAEYKQAKADAETFKAAGYTGTPADTIASWAEAKGWTDQQACDDILSTAASWEGALSAIRRKRLIGKSNVNAAADAAAAQSAADAATADIQAIPAGV